MLLCLLKNCSSLKGETFCTNFLLLVRICSETKERKINPPTFYNTAFRFPGNNFSLQSFHWKLQQKIFIKQNTGKKKNNPCSLNFPFLRNPLDFVLFWNNCVFTFWNFTSKWKIWLCLTLCLCALAAYPTPLGVRCVSLSMCISSWTVVGEKTAAGLGGNQLCLW